MIDPKMIPPEAVEWQPIETAPRDMTAEERVALVERVALAMYQADDYYVSHAHAIAAIDLIRALKDKP